MRYLCGEIVLLEGITINDESGVPIWLQLRDRILFLIKSRQLKPGDTLPTVRELATQLGINYNTVHKVYQGLQSDGYISSQRGRRSTVADVSFDDAEEPKSDIDIAIEELVHMAGESGMSEEELVSKVITCYNANKNRK